MLANALELHNPTERDKFNFLSSPGARPLDLARYFKEIIANATNQEGKQQLARARELYGSKLIKELLALLDWLEGMTEQYRYNLEQFFTFNPYHAERFLRILPSLGENFLDFVTALEDKRGEDGLVTPKQIRDTIRAFLPAKQPEPRFDPGTELTETHLACFKRRLVGRSRKAEVIVEKETLFDIYLSTAEGIANGQPLKVEHLAAAIVRRGGDPAALLPRPSRRFTIWNIHDFWTENSTRLAPEDPITDGSDVSKDEIISVKKEVEVIANPVIPRDSEVIGIGEGDNAPLASRLPRRSEHPASAPVPDVVDSSTSPDGSEAPIGSGNETIPDPRLSLRPGARVKTIGTGEVGRISKRTATGWLVTFEDNLTRIIPSEGLILLSSGAPTATARSENNSKRKKSKKKGFGLSVA